MDGEWIPRSVHPLWLLVIVGIIVLIIGSKALDAWNRHLVFNSNRVKTHETSRRKIWEQKQKDFNPEVEDLEEVQKRQNLQTNNKRDLPGSQPGPKKRFNMMFGYDNMGPSKLSCSLGG
jgi:hypothetical protein